MPKMEHINLRMITYLLVIPVLVLEILSIVGCTSTSPGFPDIFLVEVRDGDRRIRVGYLGICSTSGGQTSRQASAGASATKLRDSLELQPDAYDALVFAHALQFKVFLFLPAIPGLLFLVGLVLLTLLKREQKKPTPNSNGAKRQNKLKQCMMKLIYGSVASALVSAVGLAQAVAGLKALSEMSADSESPLNIIAGTGLQGLPWSSLGCLVLFALGVSIMFPKVKSARGKSPKSTTGKTKAKTPDPDPLAGVV